MHARWDVECEFFHAFTDFCVSFCQFFNFHNTTLEHVLILPTTAVQIVLQRDSNLLAVICDDLVVRVVDIETRRIVREMSGFRGRILDVVCCESIIVQCFSHRLFVGVLTRFPMVDRHIIRLFDSDIRCAYRSTH